MTSKRQKANTALKTNTNHTQPTQAKPLGCIKVKPTTDGASIDDLLKGFSLPSGLGISSSKILDDGSKLIYTQQEPELRSLLVKVKDVTVMDPISFLPKLKVLSVPLHTSDSTITAAMGCTSIRLLRTIKKNGSRHLVYEVDPESYKRLIHSRIYLDSMYVHQVVPYEDVPICTHCLVPGHSAERCKRKDQISNPLCAKCGKHDHKSAECTSPTLCCINCVRAKKRNTNHSAFDQKRCPVLISHAQWRQSRTNYGQ